MDEVVSAAFLVACAAVSAFLLTGVQIRLNGVLSLTSMPRSDRWHRRPTPSSGGIAMFLTIAAVYVVMFRGRHVSIAAGAAGLCLLGLADDLLRLPPWAKLLGQSVAAAYVVASGVVFHASGSVVVNVLFSFCWLVGITNAFNLIDNMDGLCAGVAIIIAALRFVLLAAHGDWADANLCALIGAAYAGFLIWNYNPAKIFMGDCGSMLAGFSLAALTIATPIPHTKAFLAGIGYPVLTFMYPIFDTTLVSVLRKLAGRPISQGGKDHSSHRLVSLGFSEARVVWMLWLFTAAGSTIALTLQSIRVGIIAGGSVLSMAVLLGVVLALVPTDSVSRPGGVHELANRRRAKIRG